MTYEEAQKKLTAYGQEQLLAFYDELAEEEQVSLLQQIDETDCLHQLIRAFVISVFHKADQSSRKTGILKPVMDSPDDCPVRAEGLAPAAQNHGVARF